MLSRPNHCQPSFWGCDVNIRVESKTCVNEIVYNFSVKIILITCTVKVDILSIFRQFLNIRDRLTYLWLCKYVQNFLKYFNTVFVPYLWFKYIAEESSLMKILPVILSRVYFFKTVSIK